MEILPYICQTQTEKPAGSTNQLAPLRSYMQVAIDS